MKQLPPGERVWFIDDLRKQMADGTRFDRKPKEPEISEDLEKLLQARLALFPALSDIEKTRIAAQLRKMPKEDWDEIFDTLAISQVSKEELEPEVLRPDEFPSLTEEERRKVLEQIEGLTDEEREKVLKTFREKHDKPKSEGKSAKEKKD
jgi:predicted HAD superfamily phosphohydrolase